jgi:hypothetical protein
VSPLQQQLQQALRQRLSLLSQRCAQLQVQLLQHQQPLQDNDVHAHAEHDQQQQQSLSSKGSKSSQQQQPALASVQLGVRGVPDTTAG